ncbi:MAG TPA: alkaline phosphatase D family protein [Steroidobacteraceae bacterium]|nr:alkaline phosphatase D family protein [Steroidobacteraceae bacterium]
MTTRRKFLALTGASLMVSRGLRAAEYFRFSENPFSLGVASGYPTPDSVVLWTRLAPSPLEPDGGMPPAVVAVDWAVATDERMRNVVQHGTDYATPDWAHSIHVEPSGLDPGREYWYRFEAGGVRSPVGHTRTAPAYGASLDRLKLGLVCCQHYEQGYYTAYRHMLADNLDLIVHVGDYIYEGNSVKKVRNHNMPVAYTLDDYRARHALYRTDRDLANAHAAAPWLVIWDDHDVANDYADDVSEEDDDPQLFLARRAAAYQAYYEHLPLPRWAVPSGPAMRLYAQRSFGDLATIVLLDQRQYRSPEACPPLGRAGGHRVDEAKCPELDDPARTMLGGRQEAWAQGQLLTSASRWNLLAQGTLMGHNNEAALPEHRYWTDAWNGYPAARERLMRFLAERHIANPVVLSGDIHAFVVSDLHLKAADLDSPMVAPEFVTTSISSDAVPETYFENARKLNPNLLTATGLYRGYVSLDITKDHLRADLIAVDTVKTPDSGRHTLASYVVESGKPALVTA